MPQTNWSFLKCILTYQMRKVYQLIIIIGLVIAISACTPKDGGTAASQTAAASTDNSANTRIVFVNQDTLLNQYHLYQESKSELEEQSQKAQNSISSKLQAFQRKVEKFQKKVYETQQKAASIAPVELQRLEKQFASEQEALAVEEQKLVKQRDNSAFELEEKLIALQSNLKSKVDEYLAELAAEKSYDFVLIKGNGGGVLYGNNQLDITDDVVTILNERYAAASK